MIAPFPIPSKTPRETALFFADVIDVAVFERHPAGCRAALGAGVAPPTALAGSSR